MLLVNPTGAPTQEFFAANFGGVQPSATLDSVPSDAAARFAALASHAKNYADYAEEHGVGKEVIGVNNIGVITFRWPGDPAQTPLGTSRVMVAAGEERHVWGSTIP